jgi:rare lipoprotein A
MIRHLPDLLIGVAILCGVAFLFGAGPVKAAECQPMKVSWYGNEHHGRKTASGAVFDQNALTAAMPDRKHLGERWRVTYGKRSVVVTITDTGAFAKYGRGMDLSRGAFAKLAHTDKGIIRVCVERL